MRRDEEELSKQSNANDFERLLKLTILKFIVRLTYLKLDTVFPAVFPVFPAVFPAWLINTVCKCDYPYFLLFVSSDTYSETQRHILWHTHTLSHTQTNNQRHKLRDTGSDPVIDWLIFFVYWTKRTDNLYFLSFTVMIIMNMILIFATINFNTHIIVH